MSAAGLSLETATSRGGELREVVELEVDLIRARMEERFAARSWARLALMEIFMSDDAGTGSPMAGALLGMRIVFLVG